MICRFCNKKVPEIDRIIGVCECDGAKKYWDAMEKAIGSQNLKTTDDENNG